MNQTPETFWAQMLVRVFKEETPGFFKIILRYAVVLSFVAAVMPVIVTAIPQPPHWLQVLTPYIVTVCTALAGAGIGGAAIAKTTSKKTLPNIQRRQKVKSTSL